MGRSPFARAREAFDQGPTERRAPPKVTFSEEVTQVRLERADLERVRDLAEHTRLPAQAVVTLLVRAGLEAVKRESSLLLGAAK